MADIKQIIAETRASACVDCGKCTVACPVAGYDAGFSPRRLVDDVRARQADELAGSNLWDCITCGRCEVHCQSGVDFTGMVKQVRAEAKTQGFSGDCTHGGALESLMTLLARPGIRQDRSSWLGNTAGIDMQSDTAYFMGCLPYLDIIFADLGVKLVDTARGAVGLMNAARISPALLPGERCCGHDLLWAGDESGFIELARQNIEEINKSGARRVVTTCAECYYTLAFEYPRHIGDTGVEVVHITQLLEQNGLRENLSFSARPGTVTYQDPCRLGRFAGVYEEPRNLLGAVPGVELYEMERNRGQALCCGTTAWINCGQVNKQIQTERLNEAAATGAGKLITACPKCQIHLACALHDGRLDKQINVKIEDITAFVAGALATSPKAAKQPLKGIS